MRNPLKSNRNRLHLNTNRVHSSLDLALPGGDLQGCQIAAKSWPDFHHVGPY